MRRRLLQRQHEAAQQKLLKTSVRKHLSGDALIGAARNALEEVAEPSNRKPEIPIADAFMSAFAMFFS